MELDTDDLAQKLYDASFTAQEVKLSDLRRILSKATPGHEAIDEPEGYRWFLIKKFPVKDFGITLRGMMEEAGSAAGQEKWQHDRILDLLRAGETEWPALATADGIVIDGYHRISAHGTMRHKNMSVVVAARRPDNSALMWDEMWNTAFP
jgi:hypothetical protein